MKRYTATFWRANPQLANGGYETKRTVEAKTRASAEKKAQKIADECNYGSMTLLHIEEE